MQKKWTEKSQGLCLQRFFCCLGLCLYQLKFSLGYTFFFLGSLGTGMKQISVIGKEVENKNGQQPCKLLVTSFDTNDLDLQPPPPFPEKRPKSTTSAQRPTSFLENIKVGFNLEF